MRNLFNLDNPFIQFLSRLSDLMVLNALFIVCSLPIVTIGASACALIRVCQDITYDSDSHLVRSFFRAFKSNFKQATIVWLLIVVVTASLICDVLLIMAYCDGAIATILYILLGVLAFLVAGVCAYLFPLIVRYSNTLRNHFNNALILSIVKLPRTFLLVLMELLPLVLLIVSVGVFVQTLIFWVILGFSFIALLGAYTTRPVFSQLEAGNDSVTLGI